MWNCIEKILTGFKGQFSRVAAFKWFVVIVVGLMVRTDKLGITSMIRALSIAPQKYESILHFLEQIHGRYRNFRLAGAKLQGVAFHCFSTKTEQFLWETGQNSPKKDGICRE